MLYHVGNLSKKGKPKVYFATCYSVKEEKWVETDVEAIVMRWI